MAPQRLLGQSLQLQAHCTGTISIAWDACAALLGGATCAAKDGRLRGCKGYYASIMEGTSATRRACLPEALC